MGLDMYLSADFYVGGWKHNEGSAKGRAEIETYEAINKLLGTPRCEGSPSVTVKVNVAYWRKSNQIHAWFVENVGNGEDKCDRHYVEREKLQALVDECKGALKDKNPQNLPPKSGFFFGSTDIDEWYWKDLEQTVEMLEAVLANKAFEHCDFYYQASW